jgi:hypothetical protein
MSNGEESAAELEITPYRASSGAGFWVALIVAIVLVVAYVVLCGLLYFKADHLSDANLWTRLTYIAGGLSSFVSTAVGWLFGREVHRAAAEHATEEAGRMRQVAVAARKDADRGSALAEAVKAAAGASVPAQGIGQAAGELTSLAASHLNSLKALAENLFPSPPTATPAGS